MRNHITKDSWIDELVLPEYLEPDLQQIWNLHSKKPTFVRMFGKVYQSPRYEQSYEKVSIPEYLLPIFNWANQTEYGPFTNMLVNLYENGHNYIAKHRDNESYLVPDSPILSISFGANRKLRIRNYKTNQIIQDISMPHGTVLVMGGKFNTELTHEVPKIMGRKGEKVDMRINITFRQYKFL